MEEGASRYKVKFKLYLGEGEYPIASYVVRAHCRESAIMAAEEALDECEIYGDLDIVKVLSVRKLNN